MGFKIIRTNDASQPADAKFINMTDWLINNTLGKDRRRFDAMAYNVALNNNTFVYHVEADVLKNVSEADINLYYAPDNSETGLVLNYDKLLKGSYLSVRSYREFKLGTAVTPSVSDTGSITAQVVTLSGLTTTTGLNYHIITVPTDKVSTLTIGGGTLVKNTEVLGSLKFPSGVTSLLFLATSSTVTFTFTVSGGVGLTTGSSTQVKCFPVAPWALNELAIISCSD